VPGRRAGLRGALAHIGDVADPAGRRVVRHVVGEDEDRYAVVVVALPAAGMFVCVAAGDDVPSKGTTRARTRLTARVNSDTSRPR
jgi:hypothetical protein